MRSKKRKITHALTRKEKGKEKDRNRKVKGREEEESLYGNSK